MKLDFTQPSPKARTLEEAQEIIDALWLLCAEIPKLRQQIDEQVKQIEVQQKRIAELEEKLNTNSNNSSKPPSTNHSGPKRPKKKNKKQRKRGGQVGHAGITRHLLAEADVDHIEQHQPPTQNCACGGHIQISTEFQRHQVHEIPPIKTIVTEHQLFCGCCTQCGKKYQAELPSHVPSGMLGPCLMALIATLGSDYSLSKRNITRLLDDLYGLSICIATVKRAEEAVSKAIETSVDEANAYVKAQKIVNCDETSHAECGKKMWTWVAIANTVAVFMIAASRGAIVAKALLGEAFSGILCTDRYSAYSWVTAMFRQVCWAHLVRDFRKISERSGESKMLGLRLLVYAKRMFHYWHKMCDGEINREEFIELMRPIRLGVELLLLKGSQIERKGHEKTKGTCLEILKIKVALWRFVERDGIEPTNNMAEQVLRKIVIWRKICFGTWSASGSRYLERVMTVVATCRLQERSVYGFLCETMQAQFAGKQAPSLLPIDA